MVQQEKLIEGRLLELLEKRPSEIFFRNHTTEASSLADLIGRSTYIVFHDNNAFNLAPQLMQDLIGGMTPDIVLRSKASEQNRIYIEVKHSAPLNYGFEDSQITRYFLHLLATSTKAPVSDIKRAVLLCAPSAWFGADESHRVWNHFLTRFSGLATVFDIALGEINADVYLTAK